MEKLKIIMKEKNYEIREKHPGMVKGIKRVTKEQLFIVSHNIKIRWNTMKWPGNWFRTKESIFPCDTQ